MQYLAASSNIQIRHRCPTTPRCMHLGLGSSPFAHHYLENHFCFLFLQLLRCFNSLGSLFLTYIFSKQFYRLPHSETSGSMFASNSPEHIVGNHVLLRLCVPRYPPLALYSLTTLDYLLQFYTITSPIISLFNQQSTKAHSFYCLLSSRYLCSFQGSGWNLLQQSEFVLHSVAELNPQFTILAHCLR